MKRKTVLACIESAIRCGHKADAATSEEDALEQLRWAERWLEVAKRLAKEDEPNTWRTIPAPRGPTSFH
jgi:hypothetical protein